jgi:hypothetical protein
LQHDLALAVATEPLVGDRRAGDVAAQPVESRSLWVGKTFTARDEPSHHLNQRNNGEPARLVTYSAFSSD